MDVVSAVSVGVFVFFVTVSLLVSHWVACLQQMFKITSICFKIQYKCERQQIHRITQKQSLILIKENENAIIQVLLNEW